MLSTYCLCRKDCNSIGQVTVSKPDGLRQSLISVSQLSDHSGMHPWNLIVKNSGSQTGHDLQPPSPEDIWQCLDEFWVVVTVGFYSIKTRDAAIHPTMSYNKKII